MLELVTTVTSPVTSIRHHIINYVSQYCDECVTCTITRNLGKLNLSLRYTQLQSAVAWSNC